MKTVDLSVSRTIRGAAEAVFDAWLDPTSPGGLWFGVERAVFHPLRPEVDGLFYHSVSHAGRSWPHYGRFLRLDRGRTLKYTWVSEATQGLESVVTITFVPRDGGTEVSLRHTNLPDDQMGRSHAEGWTWHLNAVASRFEAPANGS